MSYALGADSVISDELLSLIAYLPTEHLGKLVEPALFLKLRDKDFMRVATLLARKSYDEGGCPIGAVIIDRQTRAILGKGHNTLAQENDSTTHGETAALRDAGRVAKLKGKGPVDFRNCCLFTTLTPCPVCCAQLIHRAPFQKIIIGDVTNAPSTASILREGKIRDVEILQDSMAIELYQEYVEKRPELHYLDWGGHRKWEEAQKNDLKSR